MFQNIKCLDNRVHNISAKVLCRVVRQSYGKVGQQVQKRDHHRHLILIEVEELHNYLDQQKIEQTKEWTDTTLVKGGSEFQTQLNAKSRSKYIVFSHLESLYSI